MVDIHCHILPGVDDGARNMEESLRMLSRAAAAGVKTVAATPHLIAGTYGIELLNREQMTADLQKAADESGINIQIKPGVEYYLSSEMLEDTAKLKELTLNNNGKYILVELPMQMIPIYAKDIFFNLNMQGITPVLAHPERNIAICRDPNILFDFVMNGVVVQLNAGSILGCFGKYVKKTARILLIHKLVHVVASDMHSDDSVTQGHALPAVEEVIGSEEASLMFTENPGRILAGEAFHKESPQRFGHERRGLRRIFSRRGS